MKIRCNICRVELNDNSRIKMDEFYTLYHAACFPYFADLADFTGSFKEVKEKYPTIFSDHLIH